MQNFFSVWYIIAPVAFGILIGYVWGKLKYPFDQKVITNIILYVASPCLVFSVISQKEIIWREYLSIMLAAVVIMLGVGSLVFVFLKLIGKPQMRGFYLPTMMMNTANMGFPLALFAFGKEGLSRAFIFDLTFVLIMFTIGFAIVGGKKDLYGGLKVPVIYVAILSLIIASFKIRVPTTILRSTELIGQLLIPLMLLLLGYHLSKVKIKSWGIPIAGAMLRFFGGLLVGYLFVSIFPLSEVNRNVILLYSALPSAMMAVVLTEKYDQDADIAASTVVISTFSAIILLPILLYLI